MICENCGHPARKTIPDDLKKLVIEFYKGLCYAHVDLSKALAELEQP
jgi:hypothetical protein